MEVKRFFSNTMQDALRMVREEFGADAVILSNAKIDGGVEIVAALDYEENWEAPALDVEISNHGEPSPSQLARMHAEKHLQLQKEMEQAKRKIEAARSRKVSQPLEQNLANNGARKSPVGEFEKEKHKQGENWETLSAMRAEILEIKDLLARQPKNEGALNARQKSQLEQQIEKMLESLCASRSLKETLMKELQNWLKYSNLNDGQENTFEQAWKHLAGFIEKSMRVEHTEIIDRSGIFALVGPTGSGKTMTIGKMAARYVMEYGAESIALVTTDRYRIAAHEQLKVFGRILNIPVHSVDETHSLDIILDSLVEKKVVLIDTAGLMHTDHCWSEQLQELKLSRHPIHCYLTISAVGQYQVMSANYHHYQMLELEGAVVTKVDEAVSLGEAISFLVDTGLKAAYYTDGQRVPEDIHLFDAYDIFQRAQTLLNSSERWVTIRASEHSAQSILSKGSALMRETKLFHSA